MAETVRDVVKNALRLMGGLASGDEPTNDEVQDALLSYNTMVRGWFGTIIGPRLSPYPAAASLTAENGGQYQIAAAAVTITLPANPRNGNRVAVVDANLNFATNNCIINRNGRLLEGAAANLTLSVSGGASNRTWFFRGDTGNWTLEADALIDANPYFPDALISHMAPLLAVQILSEYGGEIRGDLVLKAANAAEAFKRVYSRRGRNQADAPLSLVGAQPS